MARLRRTDDGAFRRPVAIQKILDRAADYLEERGWIQGQSDGPNEERCAGSAVVVGEGGGVSATVDDIVRAECFMAEGRWPSDAEVSYILWNYTGYPDFWPMGQSPLRTLIDQLRRFFSFSAEGFVPCARCGGRARDWICEPCNEQWRAEDQP